MKTLLITGAVGHIGTNITIEAIKRGYKVIAMDNLHREEVINNLEWLQETYTKDQFEFIWGDVRNKDDFDRIPIVDAIIHLAANPGIMWSINWPTYDFDTNAKGTLNALEFARKCGNVPFVYASTNKTFSDIINELPKEETETRYVWTIDGRLTEDNPITAGVDEDEHGARLNAINENFPVTGFGKYGHSMYGISKLTGDLYVQEYHCQYGLPTTINKMSCIFGLFQKGCPDQGWVSSFLLDIGFRDKGITFFGTGKQVRDVLDARDVARLYIDEVESLLSDKKCDGEIFTVGGGPENTVSLIEAVEAIESLTGKKATIAIEAKRPADQDIYISSLRHVKEVMGWEPTIPFNQTLQDMIEEYSK